MNFWKLQREYIVFVRLELQMPTCAEIVWIQGAPGQSGTGTVLSRDVHQRVDGVTTPTWGGLHLECTSQVPDTHHAYIGKSFFITFYKIL